MESKIPGGRGVGQTDRGAVQASHLEIGLNKLKHESKAPIARHKHASKQGFTLSQNRSRDPCASGLGLCTLQPGLVREKLIIHLLPW